VAKKLKYICYGVRQNGEKFEARLRGRYLGLFSGLEEAKRAVALVDFGDGIVSLDKYKALQAASSYDEYLRLAFSYDPNTGLIHRRIRRLAASPIIGPSGVDRYVQVFTTWRGKKRRASAHRLAFFLHEGHWPEGVVDHVNGVKSDNRLFNLRVVDETGNSENVRRPNKRNKSGFMGVIWFQNKWRANITVNRKTKWLGDYATPEEAHAAYLGAKRLHHATCTI